MPEVIPGSRIDTNREVSAKRCEELANYYINNADRWILPPVLVDSELDLEFISQGTITVGNATLLGEANAKKAVTIDVGVRYQLRLKMHWSFWTVNIVSAD
jgi:hypothetical protein